MHCLFGFYFRGDDKVRTKVLRLFTIWNERNIYDESFLVDLVGLLSSRTPAQASVPDAQDFQVISIMLNMIEFFIYLILKYNSLLLLFSFIFLSFANSFY